MGTQVSLFQFKGRVGNMVSYYLKEELVVRTIGKVDLEKMRTAPQYEETRKNQCELGLASSGGKLFRSGLLHFTQGHTNHDYASKVVQIMINTLRSDMTQPKGHKTIKNGLKNASSQQAFCGFNFFHKYNTKLYGNILVKKTHDQKAWRLNRQILFGKGVEGNQMTVKIGYYHVDFEGRVANYEHALSIACHRNEMIEFSDFTLPKPNETGTPWTFVIMQVCREGTIQEVTGMTYMSVLDLVDNEANAFDNINELKEELTHKCGREMVDSDKQKWYESDGKGGAKLAKGQGLQNVNGSLAEVTHGYRMHREDMVKFGGRNWDDAIGKAVKEK